MKYVCHVPGIKKWDEPEQIKIILDDLELYKDKIVGLDFSENSIGEKCAEALGKKMKEINHLRILNLNDCFVSRGKEELPKCLKFLLEAVIDKPIKELDLSNNALGPTAAPGYEFFFKGNKTLENLYLDNDGLGPIGTEKLMEVINNNNDMPLKVLALSRNKMETKGCNAVVELIKNKKKIYMLDISSNEIDKEGMYNLILSLKDNKTLKSINLQNNTLGDKADILLEVLPSIINIENLNLSDLTFSGNNKEMVDKLICLLPSLNKLREFFFEYNFSEIDFENLGDKKKYLTKEFDLLLKIKNLRELNLENNEISDNLYREYLPKFEKIGVYNFKCISSEEEMDDLNNDSIDMTDLIK